MSMITDWDKWKLAISALGRSVDASLQPSDLSVHEVNATTTAATPFYTDYTTHRVVIGVWEMLLFLIGVPANALVIYLANIIIRKMDQRENQQLCILSMAVADFLFTSIHCPIMCINFAFSVDLNSIACRLLYFVTHLSTVASSLSLLCLNIDKFVSICFPLRYYSILTYQRVKACIALCWSISLVWATFFVVGPYTEFQDRCEVYTTEAYGYLAFVTLFFLLPIASSLGISLYVISVTRRARRRDYQRMANGVPLEDTSLTTQGRRWRRKTTTVSSATSLSNGSSNTASLSNHSSSVRRRSRLRTVTFVFSTTLWSSLTFIPYRMAYLVYHFYDDDLMVTVFFGLLAVMVTNAAGNPFITIATQYQYRNNVRRLLPRKTLFRVGSDTTHRSMCSMASFYSNEDRRQRRVRSERSAEVGERLIRQQVSDSGSRL